MKTLLTASELEQRAALHSLPLADDGNLDVARVELALTDATGIIVAQLPWLLKDNDIINCHQKLAGPMSRSVTSAAMSGAMTHTFSTVMATPRVTTVRILICRSTRSTAVKI